MEIETLKLNRTELKNLIAACLLRNFNYLLNCELAQSMAERCMKILEEK